MSSTAQSSYLVAVQHLGIQSAEALCIALHEHSKANAEMLIDLSLVEAYDPIGVQLLYSCQKTSTEAGQSFAVIHAAPGLGELLKSLGLKPEMLRGVTPETRVGQDKSVSMCGDKDA